MSVFDQSSAADGPKNRFEFHGSFSEMLPIIIKNFLLSIVTLGFYRFWGRTEIRSYLWRNTRFMGDSLEYTGTGWELLKGFLIAVFFVFLPIFAVLFWAQLEMAKGNGFAGLVFFVTYLFLGWLGLYAHYMAQRYRMTRTRWRGLRGGQRGSGLEFATKNLLRGMVTAVTFFLAFPWLDNKLWSYEANHKSFGDRLFAYDGSSKTLFAAFFASIAAYIVGIIALVVLMGVMGGLTSFADMDSGDALAVLPMLFLFYLAFGVLAAAVFSIYTAAQLRTFFGHLTFGDARIVIDVTVGDVLKLTIVNILIIIGSLGILFPWTQARTLRFMVDRVFVEGDLDLGSLRPASGDDVPETGEGLAEGFDMGTI